MNALPRYLNLAVLGIAALALFGHFLNHPSLYTWRGTSGTSIPTATMFLLLSLGLLLRRNES